MSANFKITSICVLLSIFILIGITLLIIDFAYISTRCDILANFNVCLIMLCNFLFISTSLVTIIGFIRRKKWARLAGVIICLIVIVMTVIGTIASLSGAKAKSIEPYPFGGRNVVDILWMLNIPVGIFLLVIITIIFIVSLPNRYFNKDEK